MPRWRGRGSKLSVISFQLLGYTVSWLAGEIGEGGGLAHWA
jgi:hypothetical protein